MATLSTESVDFDGVEATYNACAGGGDEFTASNKTFVVLKSTHTSAQTATFATQKTVDGLAVADVAIAVDQDEEFIVGPFPPDLFADGDGLVQVTYSGVTLLTIAVLSLDGG